MRNHIQHKVVDVKLQGGQAAGVSQTLETTMRFRSTALMQTLLSCLIWKDNAE